MSKKYRLIKEYPNSPELGFITDETMYFPASYPEFWEEVVEKQWEVLEGVASVEISLTTKNISQKIYKVRRLSDNTIFSIGNKIKVEGSHVSKIEEITKIELNKEGVPCLFTKSFHNNGVNIMKAIKCEKLFTTEDGVNLYVGDKFWHVNPQMMIGEGKALEGGWRKEYKHFSTGKSAKEYVEKNKPIVKFTTEDGVGINSSKKLYGVVLCNLHPYKASDLAEHEYNYNVSINLKDFKWFADENKAIEYIDLNKPRFSKKDLLDLIMTII